MSSNESIKTNKTTINTVDSGPSKRTTRLLSRVLSLDDFEIEAKKLLPRPIFGYISGAAENNVSRKRNRESFDDYEFLSRVLNDVSKRTTTTELFGKTYAAPFGIAPIGLSALYAYRGDIVLAKGAAQENVPMILSGTSLIRLEEVIKANPDAWFQAYLPGDDANIDALLQRVEKANFKTLVLTVDTCVPGNRENNVRAGFSTPLKPSLRLLLDGMLHPRWSIGTFLKTITFHGIPHFENSYAHRGAPILSPTVERDFSFRDHLNWSHVERIRKLWKGTFVIKGILNPEDARKAVEIGADGIIVSNHGGRQLDGAIAPLHALPAIVQACPNIPVMMDSGIRRGGDVIKALALGASFVFAGRPFAYASSVAGEAGVQHALGILKSEMMRNMALVGVNDVRDININEQVIPYSKRVR